MTAGKPCPNTTSTCFKKDYEGELLCHLSNSQCSFFLFSRTKNSAIYWFEMGYHRNKDWVRSGCIYQLILCVYLSDVKGILGHFKLAKCSEDYIRRKVRQLTSASLPKTCGFNILPVVVTCRTLVPWEIAMSPNTDRCF